MKKALLPLLLCLLISITNTQCASQGGIIQSAGGSGNVALGAIKSALGGGLDDAINLFNDPTAFAKSSLIDAVLPKKLKSINQTLEKLGLASVVGKEKALIGDIAQATTQKSKPIVQSVINNMSSQDALKILKGGKTGGTSYLKEQSYDRLVEALSPIVKEKTQALGLNKLLQGSLAGVDKKGGGLLGLGPIKGLLSGTINNKRTLSKDVISSTVTEQLVNGLFKVIENKEVQLRNNPMGALKGLLSK